MGRKRILMILACLAACASVPAVASDGRIEINQARALVGGVTSGDLPGFPVTISEGGSYILTGDLVVPDTTTDGVVIETDSVSLDLNGFSISGAISCTDAGTSVSCSPVPLSQARGIAVEPFYPDPTPVAPLVVMIRNGTIRGMRYGIFSYSTALIEGVTVTENLGNGMSAAYGSILSENQAFLNGGDGIHLSAGSLSIGNVARLNDPSGFSWSRPGNVFIRSISHDNKMRGFEPTGTSGAVLLVDSAVGGNGLDGIECSSYDLVIGATAEASGAPILPVRGCTVTRSVMSGLGAVGSAKYMAPNACNGDLNCP